MGLLGRSVEQNYLSYNLLKVIRSWTPTTAVQGAVQKAGFGSLVSAVTWLICISEQTHSLGIGQSLLSAYYESIHDGFSQLPCSTVVLFVDLVASNRPNALGLQVTVICTPKHTYC